MPMLSDGCRPGDAETTFHKCVSFIPEGKQHMFDVERSHDISNKTPHLLFPAIKYR